MAEGLILCVRDVDKRMDGIANIRMLAVFRYADDLDVGMRTATRPQRKMQAHRIAASEISLCRRFVNDRHLG